MFNHEALVQVQSLKFFFQWIIELNAWSLCSRLVGWWQFSVWLCLKFSIYKQICTKCVKCKSCGATTPGSDSQATWTYDFSLCFECGRLMDKGNFCPICRKCYSDDDWESKMIQCNMCESWVHSKCEGLTGNPSF